MTTKTLLADIGGTNVRLATLSAGGRIEAVESWLTALYPDFAAAVRAYAELTGLALPLSTVAVCAAGPVINEKIDLTNCDWEVSVAGIARATGAAQAVLVNDFAAVARAVPALGPNDAVQIGGGAPAANAPKAVLGPGTGLGVASIAPDARGGWIALPGEGGHVELAPTNEREIAVLFHLIREYGHVSVERVLSGPGLETLYLALAALDGIKLNARPVAADIASAARAKRDAIAVETIALFTGWLGSVAGNLALTLGAHGGVYIAGGIVPQWGDLFDARLFRRRFEAKGRMKAFLAPIPTYILTARDLAFRGLAEIVRGRP
jgi:glucokinase